MRLLVCGIRHRQAGLDIRDQVALTSDELPKVLEQLTCQNTNIAGVVVLSTCNRSELYVVTDDIPAARRQIFQTIDALKGIDEALLAPYFFTLIDEDAVLHLMRVASGLDSLIIGEGQILNQVKDAYQFARHQQTLHPILERWFQQALTVGKRIRTETGIAKKDVSVSRAAYNRAKAMVPGFFSKRITLIGGGKMATLLMSSLAKALPDTDDRQRITIVNRSQLRLQELVSTYGFKGVTWDGVQSALDAADVVFVATGAPHVLLTPEHFDTPKQKHILDVSVPRNVDPAVGQLAHINLTNTDDLKGDMPLSQLEQAQLLADAERIIVEEYQAFYQWQLTLSAVPTITRLRDRVETIRQEHIAPHAKHSHAAVVDKVSRRLVNSLFHQPLSQLRQGESMEALGHQIALMNRLFDLNNESGVG